MGFSFYSLRPLLLGQLNSDLAAGVSNDVRNRAAGDQDGGAPDEVLRSVLDCVALVTEALVPALIIGRVLLLVVLDDGNLK